MENEEMQQRFEDFDELYKTRRFAELKDLMLKTEPQDVAKFMEDNLSDADLLFFFRLLPKDMATDVFVEIPTDMQEELIRIKLASKKIERLYNKYIPNASKRGLNFSDLNRIVEAFDLSYDFLFTGK